MILVSSSATSAASNKMSKGGKENACKCSGLQLQLIFWQEKYAARCKIVFLTQITFAKSVLIISEVIKAT